MSRRVHDPVSLSDLYEIFHAQELNGDNDPSFLLGEDQKPMTNAQAWEQLQNWKQAGIAEVPYDHLTKSLNDDDQDDDQDDDES